MSEVKKIERPLSEHLWEFTADERMKALNSDIIQGLKEGTLNPTDFGTYMVQDAVYCYKLKQAIDIASAKAQDEQLRDFLEKRSKFMAEKLIKPMFKEWCIKDPKGIALGEAVTRFSEYEMAVAKECPAVYFILVLLVGYRLFPWIGEQIGADDPSMNGVYKAWVAFNMSPSHKLYKKMEEIINEAYKAGTINLEDSETIYKRCMEGEANFFNDFKQA